MLTEIKGIKVGQWSDNKAATGCTVILFPENTIASGEIREGPPLHETSHSWTPADLLTRLMPLSYLGGQLLA